ncbi:transglycosylase domain-containing protein [Escherichia coli]
MLAGGVYFFAVAAAASPADRLWPLPLREVTPARVVVGGRRNAALAFRRRAGRLAPPVTLADVSPRYLQALIQYEDRWFWDHPGVNPFSIVRAAWQDLTSGRVISGGSTLTMQVARLLDPHPRTFGGKLRQLWRALQLEWHLSKRDPHALPQPGAFGDTLQGIGAASWAYLSKPPAQLSYGEAALLAVLPQAPSRLRPDRWPARAQAARDKVLLRMENQGVWAGAAGTRSHRRAHLALSAADAAAGAAFCARPAASSRAEKVGERRRTPDYSGSWKTWR